MKSGSVYATFPSVSVVWHVGTPPPSVLLGVREAPGHRTQGGNGLLYWCYPLTDLVKDITALHSRARFLFLSVCFDTSFNTSCSLHVRCEIIDPYPLSSSLNDSRKEIYHNKRNVLFWSFNKQNEYFYKKISIVVCDNSCLIVLVNEVNTIQNHWYFLS